MKPAAKSGIRVIAIYEAVKGIVGLVAGFGLLSLINRDIVDFAEDLIGFLHLNSEGRLAHRIVETIIKLNPSNIKIFFFIALVYATKQLVEAYGLWRLRAWAEWVAIISGLVYIPIEIYELIHKPTFTRAGILIFNVAIVVYLFYFRKEQKHEKEIHDSLTQSNVPNAPDNYRISIKRTTQLKNFKFSYSNLSSYKRRHYAAQSVLDFIYGTRSFSGCYSAADVGNPRCHPAFVSVLVARLPQRMV